MRIWRVTGMACSWLAMLALSALALHGTSALAASPYHAIAAQADAKDRADTPADDSDDEAIQDDRAGTPPSASWLDNLSFHGGLDGSKAPEDLGINANFGGRFACNCGFPIFEKIGLGGQLGTAVNYSRSAVTVLETVTGTVDRTQSFTSAGLFQRTEGGLLWAFTYDFLYEDYYTNMAMGQWRGQCGYCMTDCDEMGMWGTIGDFGEHATLAGFAFSMVPISQGNVYWKHHWASGGVTSVWAGMADQHGRFVLVNPGAPPIQHPFVFGANLYVPLNHHLALFGEANFITPNDTGTVTAYLGLAFYPGGRVWSAATNRFAPPLNVANNPTFAVDLKP